ADGRDQLREVGRAVHQPRQAKEQLRLFVRLRKPLAELRDRRAVVGGLEQVVERPTEDRPDLMNIVHPRADEWRETSGDARGLHPGGGAKAIEVSAPQAIGEPQRRKIKANSPRA